MIFSCISDTSDQIVGELHERGRVERLGLIEKYRGAEIRNKEYTNGYLCLHED